MTWSKLEASESVPAPRAIARSMLSFGMENERAFSTAFCSARLPSTSAPPSFAATMIARESLEKSLPRLTSAAPFLCLIVDHLLCPDMGLLSNQIQEPLVHARVTRQLRMERGDKDTSVAREDAVAFVLGQHLDAGPDLLDPGRADEDAADGRVLSGHVQICLEAPHLATERVAAYGDVGEAEERLAGLRVDRVAGDEDHPCARPEDRRLERTQRLVEAVQLHEAADGGRLPARDDEPVETGELLRLADLDCVGAERAQRGDVLAEVPLEGEDADAQPGHTSIVRRPTARP